MAIIEESIIITNEKYGEGLALDEFKKEYKLVRVQLGHDGETRTKWGYPQVKDKKPADKGIPWGVSLGQKEQAVQRLQIILKVLRGESVPF